MLLEKTSNCLFRHPGHLASGWLSLECSSNSTYGALAEEKAWTLPRLVAAQKIFDAFEFCFDRLRTIFDAKYGKVAEKEPLANWLRDHRAAIAEWRQFIVPANGGLPNQSLVAGRFAREPLLLSAANHQMPEVTWGDSVFQRIYGASGLNLMEQGFDATDFTGMFTARDQCRQLDVSSAKELYLKAQPPAERYRTLDARYDDAQIGLLDQRPRGGASASVLGGDNIFAPRSSKGGGCGNGRALGKSRIRAAIRAGVQPDGKS